MFETGSACNYQVQYVRDRHALPITRDYMLETERKYRQLGAAAVPRKKPRPPAGKRSFEAAEA
jgi:cyclopropane-fatty-acyl-phospholipid synthase